MYAMLLLGGLASWGFLALILLSYRNNLIIFHEIFMYVLALGGLMCFALAHIIKQLSLNGTNRKSKTLEDTQVNRVVRT